MKKLIALGLCTLLLCGCGKTEQVPETVPAETAAPTDYVEETAGEELSEPEAIMDPEDITEPVETEKVLLLDSTSVYDDKGKELIYREYHYDDYGRETECWEYSDGEVMSFYLTDWTSANEAEITYSYYEDGVLIRMVYDEAGRPIQNDRIDHGVVTSSTTHAYDDHGNIARTQSIYGDYAAVYRYEYTYDDQGKPLVRKEFLGEELMGWLEMTYDSQGREVSSVYYYPDGSVNYPTTSTFDGLTETRVSADADGNAYLTQITTVDEMGNVLVRETWQGGEMVSRTENVYVEVEIIAE